jgi:twinfilin-like protein
MASHSSGITVPEEVKEAFGEANQSGAKRALKIQIQDEQMRVVASAEPGSAWEDDLESVPALLDPKDACYVLFRTDEKTQTGGYAWLLFCYVPDAAKVRQKMLYASTRAQLKLSLGSGNFAHDVFGTVKADFDRAGFAAYMRMQKSAAPLTESEEAKFTESAMSAAEASCLVGAGGASTTMLHGVSFQPQPEAAAAVKELASGGGVTYVQLGIDEAKEQIALVSKSRVELAQLGECVPLDRPAFHLYRYDHHHEGKSESPMVFVYSCPDGSGKTKSAPVKSRMLYSSCKAGIEALVEAAGRKVDLKLEINDGVELTEELVVTKLHPPPVQKKEVFSKPKAAGKGPKRLTPRTSPASTPSPKI